MLVVSGIFIVCGALFVILAKLWSIRIQRNEKYKGKTDGTVATIVAGMPDQEGLSAGIHDYYYPIVAFYANGRLYKLKSDQGSNPSHYKVQQKVTVRYDEKEPTRFEIKEDNTMERLSSILYFTGLVLCCVGGIFFLLFATRY